MRKISILNSITFLSAFLLFQIELIVSKILLPDFGGSYMVWGAAVVFFQGVLFLGYLFSYVALNKLGIKNCLKLYLGLFLVPLLCFPGRNFPQINSVNLNIALVANVFWYLFWTIGPVFFALSTTSVILQSWLADSELEEKNNPYVLFALSNLGSIAALITYPFLFETFLDLDQQLLFWRIIYFVLLGLIAAALLKIKVFSVNRIGRIWQAQGVLRQDIWKWFAFSAAGVIMFLSVTNIFTYEIAPIPLLWVVPLAIYLICFVLNFKQRPWCPAWVVDKFYLVFAWSIVFFFFVLMRIIPVIAELGIFCWLLFHICMFCQYHLNKLKPANPQSLPLFYLILSLGGFIGGIFITWIVPPVMVSVSEFLLGLVAVAWALSIGLAPRLLGKRNLLLIACVCMTLMIWPAIFKDYNFFGVVAILLIFRFCYAYLIKSPRALFFSILMVWIITLFIDSLWTNVDYVWRHRNYYGIYRVYQENGKLVLNHGTTIHGVQYKDKERENKPLAYYHKDTPVGKLLSAAVIKGDIGIIGLGAGGLSIYALPGQRIDYYEIDPDVSFIAQNIFTYLKHSRGKINFIFGDARIRIKEAQIHGYELLVVDAFSGDAIPVHLLTAEAIGQYRKHLAPNGIILFHVSNRYLNFIPVLFSNANYLNAYGCYQTNLAPETDRDVFDSSWFALTWDQATFNKLLGEFQWKQYSPGKYRLLRPWTDKYSNMLLIISVNGLLSPLKHFKLFYW
jgi:SAM-dependent methyltransferase